MAVKVIAHRGAPVYHLENTISTFRRALKLGVDMIELDIQVTKDGIPIVIHDNTVDRVTEASGLVRHFNLKDIRMFKVGQDTIPTVEEVVVNFKDKIDLLLDIKTIDAVDPLKKIIKQYGLKDKILISSFRKNVIRSFEEWDSMIKTGLLCWRVTDAKVKFALDNNVEFIHPYHLFLSKGKIADLHERGLGVNVWTVDYAWGIKRSLDNKVDGIITNRPVLLNKIKEVAKAMVLET
ncbi:hypothetical protein KKC60_00355 [Patescibacteria group bacterium]|nr:hypothetical protein [Patescibacteria group bacterium]